LRGRERGWKRKRRKDDKEKKKSEQKTEKKKRKKKLDPNSLSPFFIAPPPPPPPPPSSAPPTETIQFPIMKHSILETGKIEQILGVHKDKNKQKEKEAKICFSTENSLSLCPSSLHSPSLPSLARPRQAPDKRVGSWREELGEGRRLQGTGTTPRGGRVLCGRRLVLVLLGAPHPDLLVLALGLVLGVFELASSLGLLVGWCGLVGWFVGCDWGRRRRRRRKKEKKKEEGEVFGFGGRERRKPAEQRASGGRRLAFS